MLFRTTIVLASVVTAPILTASAQSAEGWPSAEPMAQAMSRVLAQAALADQVADLGFDEGMSILGASMQPGTSLDWSARLLANREYVFIGAGEDVATDVDVIVLDGATGEVVAADTLSDNNPIVRVRPSMTRAYTLRLRLYAAPRTAFCALALLREGGTDISLEYLVEAPEKAIVASALLDAMYGVTLFDEPGEWCFFGSILDGGQSTTIGGLDLGAGRRLITAVADQRSSDVDIELENSRGAIVAKDAAGDATPLLAVDASAFEAYALKVTNYRSSGSALVAAIVLKD
jgi:hypothetical protein